MYEQGEIPLVYPPRTDKGAGPLVYPPNLHFSKAFVMNVTIAP
jgi:hypothetical protein